MSAKLKLKTLMPLLKIAMDAAASKPPRERAAIFAALALITKKVDADMHAHASAAAAALRAAESHQMTFQVMVDQTAAHLTAPTKPNTTTDDGPS